MATEYYISPLFEQLDILNSIYNNNITKVSNKSIKPTAIKTELYPHQEALLQEMIKYNNKMTTGYVWNRQILSGKIGIIGDTAGSGKTLTVLSYLASLDKKPKPTNELVLNSSRYFFSHTMPHTISDISYCNLVIVPHNLFWLWESQIKKHTTMQPFLLETRRGLTKVNTAASIIASDFVLTTSKTYKYLCEFCKGCDIKFNHIFIDAAESIYFSGNDYPLEFQFLWLITTTWIPFIFKNNLSLASNLIYIKDRIPDINSELLYWLNCVKEDSIQYQSNIAASAFFKSYFPYNHIGRGELVIKNSNTFIENSMCLPEMVQKTVKCSSLLHKNIALNGHFLRTHLKKEIVPNIFSAMGLKQKPINEIILEQPTREATIRCKITDDCSICLDKPTNLTMTNCCNNIYCGECLLRNMQLSVKCPTCRSIMDIESLKWISTSDTVDVSNTIIKTRLDTCIDILNDNSNNQVIIYTMYDNVYYQILDKLMQIGIKAEKLDSNPYNVQKITNNFISGDLRVVCVSNPEYLRGLSFSNASHIIFFHELPFYEMRELLIRSAQRMGRRHPLSVIYLQPEFEL
jgi:hypothetical protein